MLPEPLHPAVVHFPIVLAVLLPIAGAVALWMIHRGSKPLNAWTPVLAISLALTGSTWAAVQTGQSEEDRVEAVVAEEAIETHEEAAELFLPLSAGVLLLVGGGLLGGRKGQASRVAAVVAALILVGQGVRVGHSGGELVYVHGAASAYVGADGAAQTAPSENGEREERERDQH